MTVQELIDKLKTFPPEMLVAVHAISSHFDIVPDRGVLTLPAFKSGAAYYQHEYLVEGKSRRVELCVIRGS